MLGDLIGEFKGKNIGFRVLPDGRIETTAQGTGKILGIDAFVLSTSVGTMANGIFKGEVTSVINTVDGDAVIMKGNAVGWSSGKGGTTRAASYHTTQSQKLLRLNKVMGLHEYETGLDNNWVGKIWEWK
jgi:hypothetical protein